MHHKLDIHPIPEKVLYVNELNLVTSSQYEMQDDYEKALTGKRISEGGILPEDNVRIYIPMDLSAENIMRQLYILYRHLGSPTESNEYQYYSEVRKLISWLEIYAQVWVARDSAHAVQKTDGGSLHSQQGIKLAKQMIDLLSEDEGCAECFPFDIIKELKVQFWL